MANTPLGGEHAQSSGPAVLAGLQSLVSQLQGPKPSAVSGGSGWTVPVLNVAEYVTTRRTVHV